MDIKTQIEIIESRLNPCNTVSVQNIRKTSSGWLADITLYDGENKTTYHDCEYPKHLGSKDAK